METDGLPKGLVVDLITPLTDSGDIDGEGLSSLLAKVLPQADGILLASPQMGEGRGLDKDLRAELLRAVCDSTEGRVPLFFWVSQESAKGTKEVIALLEGVLESSRYGGTVFWLDSPLFYHSNRGLYQYYHELTANTAHPFVLYNDAGLVGLVEKRLKRGNIRTHILRELGSIEKIKALIFRGPLARVNNYQRALNKRPDFKIYDGDEARFLEHPSLSGIISMGANVAPKMWSTITRASLGMLDETERRPDHVHEIWEKGQLLRDLMEIYRPNPVWRIKNALSDANIITSPACTSLVQPDEEASNQLTEFISRYAVE
jgi:dihydrodipicolinate synthase/N-acetylneuraminate lyase